MIVRKVSAAVAMLLVAGCTATTPPDPTGEPSGTETATTGGEQTPSTISIHEIKEGTCLGGTALNGRSPKVDVVDCAKPHRIEVFAVSDVAEVLGAGGGESPTVDTSTTASYPGKEALEAPAEQFCYTEFEKFVGMPVEPSRFDYEFFYPSDASWNQLGDRTVTCALISPDALEGSAAGTAQ